MALLPHGAPAREITVHIVSEHGADEMLRRLSDPFWFQAFGCVLGFDWHSSGVTTTVTGAVKEGIRGLERILLKTYDRAPENFETLLGIEGVGARTRSSDSGEIGDLVNWWIGEMSW